MGYKVLIVDDDPDIVAALKFSLEREHIQTVEAYDGEQALDAVRKAAPDVILLDGMLPEINGFKIARLLKFDEGFSEIPIIMLTARAQEADVKLGLETGVNEYVTKPFDMEALVALVKRYLASAAP